MQFCDRLSQLFRILNFSDMRTTEEQYKLLEELLSQARQRMNAGETEWMELRITGTVLLIHFYQRYSEA